MFWLNWTLLAAEDITALILLIWTLQVETSRGLGNHPGSHWLCSDRCWETWRAGKDQMLSVQQAFQLVLVIRHVLVNAKSDWTSWSGSPVYYIFVQCKNIFLFNKGKGFHFDMYLKCLWCILICFHLKLTYHIFVKCKHTTYSHQYSYKSSVVWSDVVFPAGLQISASNRTIVLCKLEVLTGTYWLGSSVIVCSI